MNWLKRLLGVKTMPLDGINNFGRIREIKSGWVFIEPMDWAPALWAGTQGYRIKIGGKMYRILDVDHARRGLKLAPNPGRINVNDVIIPKFWGE